MPVVLQQWIEKSEERNRRIQQLQNEVAEIMELEVMDVTYRKLVEFLADKEIEHISEMDYILRKNYEVYMSELVKGNIVFRYLRIFDKVKQEYIRNEWKLQWEGWNASGRIRMLFYLFLIIQIKRLFSQWSGSKIAVIWYGISR